MILSNPFDIDIFIDLLYFSVEGVEILSYPSIFIDFFLKITYFFKGSLYLLAKASKIEIFQKIKPIKTGVLRIKGMITKCFNMTGFHPITAKGVGQHYIDKYGEKGLVDSAIQQLNFYEIEIFDQQPDLKVF